MGQGKWSKQALSLFSGLIKADTGNLPGSGMNLVVVVAVQLFF